MWTCSTGTVSDSPSSLHLFIYNKTPFSPVFLPNQLEFWRCDIRRNHFKRITVSLGDHDVKIFNEAKNIFRKISRIIRFPSYDQNFLNGDLALLHLSAPVQFSSKWCKLEAAVHWIVHLQVQLGRHVCLRILRKPSEIGNCHISEKFVQLISISLQHVPMFHHPKTSDKSQCCPD